MTKKRLELENLKNPSGLSDCCESAAYSVDLNICSDCGEECELLEPETPEECPSCCGFGEVGPFGWEYPIYKTCPECMGSGLERDHRDPDDWHDGRVDR
jgi:DnaJ-class molecular chaperone